MFSGLVRVGYLRRSNAWDEANSEIGEASARLGFHWRISSLVYRFGRSG